MDDKIIERISEYKSLMDKGKKVSGRDVTQTYNEVFGRKLAVTNCSTCIKRRISELWHKYQDYERKKIEDKGGGEAPETDGDV